MSKSTGKPRLSPLVSLRGRARVASGNAGRGGLGRGSLAVVRMHHIGCLLYVVAAGMLLRLLSSGVSGESPRAGRRAGDDLGYQAAIAAAGLHLKLHRPRLRSDDGP